MSPNSSIYATLALSDIFVPTKQHGTRINEARSFKIQARTVLVPVTIDKLRPTTLPFRSRYMASINITGKLIIFTTTIQRPQVSFGDPRMSMWDLRRKQPPAFWSKGFTVPYYSRAAVPPLKPQDSVTLLMMLVSAIARRLTLHRLPNQNLHTTHESNISCESHVCSIFILGFLNVLKNQRLSNVDNSH